MKKYIIVYSSLLVASFGLFSCSSDDDSADTTKPVIVLNNPSDHQHFHPGESIQLNADFSDNVALASYKIEIHHAGDGHSHKTDENAEWYFIYTHSIEGNLPTFNAQHSISIPTEIEGEPIELGHYHLGIYLIDQSGNEQQKFIEIEVE